MADSRLMLSKDELSEITEYAQPAKQRQRLEELGIRYIVGRKGNPRVIRAELERWLAPARGRRTRQPNFDALKDK